MSFTSVEFILLVTAAVVLYYLVPKRFQWIVLLAANYIFYLCGGVLLTGYLLAATVCTYAAGLALERLNAKKGQLDKNLWKRRKKSVAAAALIFNFGMLYVVKYLDGTLEVLSQIAGRPVTRSISSCRWEFPIIYFSPAVMSSTATAANMRWSTISGIMRFSYRSFRRWYRGRSAGSATWAVS